MKKLLISVSFVFLFLLSYTKVKAVTIDYPNYFIQIDIEKDSTFTVTETITSRFYGEAHGVRRDVTLTDPDKLQRCLDSGLTCGGFERLIYIGIFDENDKKVDDAKFYEVETESGEKYARFEWELWPNGKYTSGETVTWKVKYKILGGIGWVSSLPYFYWNILPEDRGAIENFETLINFPSGVQVEPSSLTLYDDFDLNILTTSSSIRIERPNFNIFGNYTISYEFNENEILQPAILNYKVNTPYLSTDVYLNDQQISSQSTDTFNYFPTGEQKLTFSHFGYNDSIFNVNLASGESKTFELSLTPTPIMAVLLAFNWVFCGLGVIFSFIVAFLVYRHYQNHGRDKNMPKTIIPLFSPPKDVLPYLLGSLKDEKVDRTDVIGTIIDLAYRGYIKIKELDKKKNYLLTKTEPKKEDAGLGEIEKEIIDALFGSSESVETKNLYKRFPLKYVSIEKNIYQELVSKKYFDTNPNTVRINYFAWGGVILVFSLAALIFGSILLSLVTGVLYPFSMVLPFAILGFLYLVIANFMPVKTELGSKIYAEILGFKMYLHTAERYRLQNLGPDEFERYLSFAIVFGIEEEWAKKFDGIYKGMPEWYDGTGSVYDAIWISSFTRSFADSTITNISPVTSGSSKGSGWSGGGSFGGFSGGGGGGGSVGGW